MLFLYSKSIIELWNLFPCLTVTVIWILNWMCFCQCQRVHSPCHCQLKTVKGLRGVKLSTGSAFNINSTLKWRNVTSLIVDHKQSHFYMKMLLLLCIVNFEEIILHISRRMNVDYMTLRLKYCILFFFNICVYFVWTDDITLQCQFVKCEHSFYVNLWPVTRTYNNL